MLMILDTIDFTATHLTTTVDFMQLRHNNKLQHQIYNKMECK